MADSSPTSRLWRVSTVLVAPTAVPIAAPGPPEHVEFQSRIPEQTKTYGDTTIAIAKFSEEHYPRDQYGDSPQIECLELMAHVSAGVGAISAVEKLGPMLETLIDLMSFEMGASLSLGHMDVLDITSPVSIGDERTLCIFSSSPLDRHVRSIEMQAIQGALLGRLPESVDIPDSDTAAVLRWFVKALGTDLLHDQFIFLWIALEILCDASDIIVTAAYTCPRGHEIGTCPECDTSTTKMVRGLTIRAFLASFGVGEDQAKALWAMRQMMHGAVPFDSEKLAGLGTLVQALRAVVATGFKNTVGKTPTDAPIVSVAGLSIHPAIGLEGTRVITDRHLRPLGG